MREALFVALEGIDASGKTTLVDGLASVLRAENVTVALHKEPSHGPVGATFRRMSVNKVPWPPVTMALLSSADRHAQQDCLLTARQHADVVLADRYYLSGLAYHLADGIDPGFYQCLNQQVLKPDAYLYLDLAPEVAAARAASEPDDYWEQHDLASRLPAAYATVLDLVKASEDACVLSLDASQPPRAVLRDALGALNRLRTGLFPRRVPG